MSIFDQLANAQFGYDAGTSGTVTVPTGCYVRSVRAIGGTGATLTITPAGPNTVSGSNKIGGQGAIPIPAGATGWFELDMLAELGPGSTLAFASTSSYFVQYAKFKAGGP